MRGVRVQLGAAPCCAHAALGTHAPTLFWPPFSWPPRRQQEPGVITGQAVRYRTDDRVDLGGISEAQVGALSPALGCGSAPCRAFSSCLPTRGWDVGAPKPLAGGPSGWGPALGAGPGLLAGSPLLLRPRARVTRLAAGRVALLACSLAALGPFLPSKPR